MRIGIELYMYCVEPVKRSKKKVAISTMWDGASGVGLESWQCYLVPFLFCWPKYTSCAPFSGIDV